MPGESLIVSQLLVLSDSTNWVLNCFTRSGDLSGCKSDFKFLSVETNLETGSMFDNVLLKVLRFRVWLSLFLA